MPDSQDYEDLYALLASPESWTESQSETVHWIRRNQADSIAARHPKDRDRIDGMTAVLDDMDAAIARWKAARGSARPRFPSGDQAFVPVEGRQPASISSGKADIQ